MLRTSCFLLLLLAICFQIMPTSLQAQGLTERGLLRNVEEASHPLFALTIEFPERDFSQTFTINLEHIRYLDARKLNNWRGKYVNFDYTSDTYTSLIEITSDGKSVFLNKSQMPKTDGNLRSVTGILSNAHTETKGNIPTIIYITTSDGTILPFECFVTHEMEAVNGTKVLVVYNEKEENVIRGMSLIK